MDKITQAKEILRKVGMPEKQQSDICAYTLLTLTDIKPDDKWNDATNNWIRIHDVLEFTAEHYGRNYAENTRETIRKTAMHHFREGALIEDNGKATNSPNYRYRVTQETLILIQSFDSELFEERMKEYHSTHQSLIEKYSSKKKMQMMPVQINNKELHFSPGKHNELQRDILEKFAPRFAPGCQCLYVGDSTKRDMVKDEEKLASLGFEITLHNKMPDVVLYCEDKDWIYFVEAVTSVGPMNPKRIVELNDLTKNVTAGKIFVTAFPDFATYKKFSAELAWETEVWLSEMPDHMIHLNGDKFLGPRKSD
jgi:hypothetical protein